MEKYLRLFAALERIFGKGYVSRLMGKQSNVITLPDKQARKFLDTELNVMEASEGAVKKGVQDLNNLVSDTKRLSTLNDQELLTITNNAERLAVKVNPPAPPPAPTADVLSITTKVNKNKDPNVLIDEYNKNQTRLRLTDDEGGTAISYDEFRKLQSRNNEIEKTLESLNVKPALDEVKPEGIVIPFTKKTEDFATGGRVGMAGGGILKLAMKFFNDNNPVSAYKKYLKYVKETAQKDPAKLAPEVGGIVVGSELIHRGLRRKLKEVKEKNNENDSENLETDNRTEKAGGGVSQGLDYLTGIERREYAGGGRMGFKKGSFLINTAIDAAKNLSKKKSKKELKRQLTDDEIDDLAADVGDLDAYLDFDGTVGSAEKIRKQHKEYMDYMYYQYKTGRLDPKPGEMNTSRMQYLRNKRKEAEMTDDPKLFSPNERDELDNLEETFSPMGTSNKINISDPKTAESFTEFAKQNDPEGFKKIQKIVDDINNKNTLENFDITGRKKNAKGGRVGFAVGGGFGSVPVDPMEAMYVNTFGFNPFPKYGFNSYMDYNTARITGTPMNQNISDLEDYLGTLESAREINLPGVTKDLSAEDISRLQEEYVRKMATTSNALNPTVTASTSTSTSTPDYRQQALSEMLSRYNVSSLGDIKNFNYLIPGYKDKNNLEVRAFETRIPDLAVSRRAQQLEDTAIRAQQDQEAYKNRISQVDPNALRNSYLQNLQNTSSFDVNQYESKLRSNLARRTNNAKGGLNYLMGL
jgi:hypothetical protein